MAWDSGRASLVGGTPPVDLEWYWTSETGGDGFTTADVSVRDNKAMVYAGPKSATAPMDVSTYPHWRITVVGQSINGRIDPVCGVHGWPLKVYEQVSIGWLMEGEAP